MSGDGNVVVGSATNSVTNTQLPFTYTSAGGISFLSADPATSTLALDINGNGTLAVGTALGYTGPGGPIPTQGVIWDLTTGTRAAIVTPGATSATLLAISADGKVVGGSATFSDSTGLGNAIVQNLGSSVVTRLDPTNSYTGGSTITKLNSDGSVGVGLGYPIDLASGINGFRWTAAGGMTDLGHLNGGAYLVPTSLNASGDVVVGTALDGALGLARSFRWTTETGIVSLGVLHGDINANSIAYGVDASGNVVVGYSQSATSSSSSDGYRWTAATGMQTIPEWLNSKGIAVAGSAVTIATAQAVSADGNTVSGTLSDGNLYIARVVETTTTPVTPVDPTSPTSPSAPETPPATGAGSGIITLSNYMNSLSAAAQGPSQSLQATGMVLTGAHGSPMRGLISGNQQYVWSTGDWGRADVSSDTHANQGAIEIGYAHGIGEKSMGKIAVGRSYSDQDTVYDGNIRGLGTYILPEFISAIPGTPLYGTLSAYYNFGDVDVRRGYDNAGFQVHSTGSATQHTWAVQGRLDWLNAVQGERYALTPYTSLLYMRNRMGSYTESGGGFPVQWDARSDDSTQARLGLDAVYDLSDRVKLLGRVEGVHRFESKGSDADGEILGLSSFSLDGQKYKQNWLRFGVGMEVGVGKGTFSLAGNATTEAETTRYWGSISYRLPF